MLFYVAYHVITIMKQCSVHVIIIYIVFIFIFIIIIIVILHIVVTF